MSGNTELLNFVYQNSQMGMESLSQLLEIAEDEEFRSCMESSLINTGSFIMRRNGFAGTGTQ